MVKESLLELNNIEKIIVNTPVASIYSTPQFKSELITQALFYEPLKIIDKRKKWYKVKLLDGYEGWIHSFYTYELSGKYEKNINFSKYWVKKKFTNLIFSNGTSLTLSFGSLLPCLEFDNNIILKLYDGSEGQLDKNDLSSYENPLKLCEFIDLHIKQFLGIQYLWGGKSSFGFDCSGLIQTIFNVCGISKFPRDTSEQIKSKLLLPVYGIPSKGDIIFFKKNNIVNHVGIYIDDNSFIHSSGLVKINSLCNSSENFSENLSIMKNQTYRLNSYVK